MRGEDQVRALVVLPVAVAAAPAEGEDAVDASAPLVVERSRSVAKSGMRPTYQKSSDTVKYVLTAKTSQMSGLLKFGHSVIWFGQREHVVREPRAADVDAREDERADDGEDRHRLGEAVDRRAPLLAEEEEDGADERAGVADTDPPDEVRDVPGPVDRRRVSPDADAVPEQVRRRRARRCRRTSMPGESNPPAARRPVLGDAARSPRSRRGACCPAGRGAPRRAIGIGSQYAIRPSPGSGYGPCRGRSCADASRARRGARSGGPCATACVTRAVRVVEVAEDDRVGRAGLLAGGTISPSRSVAVLALGLDLRRLDPLHAVGALLHHAAEAHGDVGVVLHLHRLGEPVGLLPDRVVVPIRGS